MTIRVDPDELIKIEEGTIFYRVFFQGRWSRRLHPNPSDSVVMEIVESSDHLKADCYKFNGETREHYASGELKMNLWNGPWFAGTTIRITVNVYT